MGNRIRRGGNALSRIEFPDQILMTLDSPHGPNTKFLRKCLKFLIQKLNHNSGLHAKNQREISKNKVRRPPSHPLYGNIYSPCVSLIQVHESKRGKLKILPLGSNEVILITSLLPSSLIFLVLPRPFLKNLRKMHGNKLEEKVQINILHTDRNEITFIPFEQN